MQKHPFEKRKVKDVNDAIIVQIGGIVVKFSRLFGVESFLESYHIEYGACSAVVAVAGLKINFRNRRKN